MWRGLCYPYRQKVSLKISCFNVVCGSGVFLDHTRCICLSNQMHLFNDVCEQIPKLDMLGACTDKCDIASVFKKHVV